MENLKELVRFNRYKSVESFNSATDVTSSTISIVKLDENVMDIYLGRTQLTHSNFPEVNVELRNLIDSLDNKLDELKIEFNSKISSDDEKFNKKWSDFIAEFESGLADLVKYTDDLSKEIFDVKSDTQKKIDGTNQQIVDITKSISDINGLISNQNKATNELSNKVAEIKTKQISEANSIRNLNQDVAALKSEDKHLLELITGTQTKIQKISTDIGVANDSLSAVSDRVNSLEHENISISADVKSLKERITKINTNLSNDIKTNKNDISTIKLDILELTDAISAIKMDPVTLEPIKHDIIDLSNAIDAIKDKLSDVDNNKKNINTIFIKQNTHSKDIKDIKDDIVALHTEDAHIFDILDSIQKTLSNFTNSDGDINITDLINKLSKLENIDVNLNNSIINLKEKLDKTKTDLSKSIGVNKNNISNIESKIEDIYNRLSNLNISDNNGVSVDLEPIKSDIVNLTKYIDSVKTIVDQHKTKVAKLESDNISSINKINNINKDISALHSENIHILESISNIQNKLNDIINNNNSDDIEKLKDDVDILVKDNKNIKSDVKSISNNVTNINTALSKRLNITESDIAIIKNNITELEDAINDIHNENIDITPIISDIADIKQSINDVSKDLLSKIESNLSEINRLIVKDNEFTNDISTLKKDVISLQMEDTHIFKILNELQSINKTILSDVKFLKDENVVVNEEILSLKEKIRYLTGVNVDNIETLEGAHRRLTKLEATDKEFQKAIDEANTNIVLIKDNFDSINVELTSFKEETKSETSSLIDNIQKTNNELVLLKEDTKNEILSLKEKIESLTGVDVDSLETLEGINRRLTELESVDKELQNTIDELNETIKDGVNAKLKWLIL